jgi:hypothetical protein
MNTSKRTLLLVGNRIYHVKPMIPKESYFASLTSQLHNTIKQQHKGVLPSSNTSISNQCFQIVWSDLVDLEPTRTINHD